MKTRGWIGGLIVAVAALVALPAPSQGQRLLDRGVQITAWVGPYGALGKLGQTTTNGFPIAETALENGVGVGGSVEVPIPVERLSMRADLGFVPSAQMETITFNPCPLNSIVSSFPNACRAVSDGTLFTGTADLVYRTEQDYTKPHGLFSIGLGIKRYSFDQEPTMLDAGGQESFTGECRLGDTICGYHQPFTGTTTDPTLNLGFGLSGSLGGVNFIAEVTDYISIYSHVTEGRELEEMIHDLFVKFSAGVRIL